MNQNLYIVTGASRGLGFALARALLQPGNVVLGISRTENTGLATLAQAAGARLEQWPLDLDHGEQAAAMLTQWLAHRGTTQGKPAGGFASATLINNAALLPRISPLQDADPADIAKALRVGLEAPMQLCAAFLKGTAGWRSASGQPLLRRVLNISSGLGRNAMASQSVYCALKAGMDHFTRCLALEEAALPHGARVCAMAPGVVDTDMQVQLRGASAASFADRGRFVDLHAKGLLSSADDCARKLLAYLERADFGSHAVADIREV
jgi:NAD(P)-dependent dehydrogenase (short-subunit alcohol dehydrogenase family)